MTTVREHCLRGSTVIERAISSSLKMSSQISRMGNLRNEDRREKQGSIRQQEQRTQKVGGIKRIVENSGTLRIFERERNDEQLREESRIMSDLKSKSQRRYLDELSQLQKYKREQELKEKAQISSVDRDTRDRLEKTQLEVGQEARVQERNQARINGSRMKNELRDYYEQQIHEKQNRADEVRRMERRTNEALVREDKSMKNYYDLLELQKKEELRMELSEQMNKQIKENEQRKEYEKKSELAIENALLNDADIVSRMKNEEHKVMGKLQNRQIESNEEKYENYFKYSPRDARQEELRHKFQDQASSLDRNLDYRMHEEMEIKKRLQKEMQNTLLDQMRDKMSLKQSSFAREREREQLASRRVHTLLLEEKERQKQTQKKAQAIYHEYLSQQVKWRENQRKQMNEKLSVDKEYAQRVRENYEEFLPKEHSVNGYIALNTERQRQGQPIYRTNLTSRMHEGRSAPRMPNTPYSLHANPISGLSITPSPQGQAFQKEISSRQMLTPSMLQSYERYRTKVKLKDAGQNSISEAYDIQQRSIDLSDLRGADIGGKKGSLASAAEHIIFK